MKIKNAFVVPHYIFRTLWLVLKIVKKRTVQGVSFPRGPLYKNLVQRKKQCVSVTGDITYPQCALNVNQQNKLPNVAGFASCHAFTVSFEWLLLPTVFNFLKGTS